MCHQNPLRRSLQRLVLLVCVATCSAALACQVPVFRYALERWNPDAYRIVVLGDGELGAAQEEMLSQIRAAHKSKRVEMTFIDANKTADPTLIHLWKHHRDHSVPLLAAFYPVGSKDLSNTLAYQKALTKRSAASIIDSPVRREIAKRLKLGHSAVWIFVKSGNADRDKVAYETLEKQIKLDSEWLKLPSPEELEVDASVLANCKIKLQIKFSIVTVEKDNAEEQFLLDSLFNSEPDLRSFDGPFAFPVFGRGRVLYGLVNKGIVKDTIRSASSFMAGPCSCQVKNQNPGFDLLLVSDWESAIGDTLISEPIDTPNQENLEPTLVPIPPGRKSK